MNTESSNSNFAASAERIRAGVSHEFRDFLADVEDLVKETTTLTGEDLNRARTKLNQRLAEAKKAAAKMGGEISQRAQQGASDANEYVHEQPWKVIGVSAVVGLLLGFVLARRG